MPNDHIVQVQVSNGRITGMWELTVHETLKTLDGAPYIFRRPVMMVKTFDGNVHVCKVEAKP